MCVLSRPPGAPSLKHILAPPGAGEAMRGFELWEHCMGANAQGEAAWQQLGQGENLLGTHIQASLAAFMRLKCCERLTSGSVDVVRWSSQEGVPEQPQHWSGLVLLDAGGGPVNVQWQTWQDMIRAKMHQTAGSDS